MALSSDFSEKLKSATSADSTVYLKPVIDLAEDEISGWELWERTPDPAGRADHRKIGITQDDQGVFQGLSDGTISLEYSVRNMTPSERKYFKDLLELKRSMEQALEAENQALQAKARKREKEEADKAIKSITVINPGSGWTKPPIGLPIKPSRPSNHFFI